MAGGRPSKYTPELLEKAAKYMVAYKKEGDLIPSVAGLSLYLDIARSTVYDWAEDSDKEEFSDILGRILSKQESLLLNNGLSGDFNAQITKLVLGKHGYKEKHDLEVAERPIVKTTRKQFDGS